MKSVFVDTNIIFRYLLGDQTAPKILKVLKGERSMIVTDIVVAEVVWTLTRFYKWPKIKIAQFLLTLFKTGNIEFNESVIVSALDTYLKHNFTYTDAYISASMKQRGIKEIYSYDHDFDKIDGIIRLIPN